MELFQQSRGVKRPKHWLKLAPAIAAVVGLGVLGVWAAPPADGPASNPASNPTSNPTASAGNVTPTAEQAEFFKSHVKPILVEQCYSCHANGKKKGGLRLDTRADLMKGGEDGVVVIPGKPDESTMIKAVKYQLKDLKMPPPKRGQLSAAQIADLEKWVADGVPWPEVP